MNTDLHVRDCLFFNESGKLTAQFFKIAQNSIVFFQNISLKVTIFSITITVKFQNLTCINGMNGVFYVKEQSNLILENVTFENIKTIGPGTFILVLNNDKGSVRISDCIFINSFSNSNFIDYESSSTLIFENNYFSDNIGNTLLIINSGINASNCTFKNSICYYDSGCIFNIQKLSVAYLSYILIVNVQIQKWGVLFMFLNLFYHFKIKF